MRQGAACEICWSVRNLYPFLCATWLFSRIPFYVWLDSFRVPLSTCDMADFAHPVLCVTWLISTCDMTHSYFWHSSLSCATWLMHRVQHAKYFESLEDQLIEASKTLEMQRLELEALRATVKKDKENRILVQGFFFSMFVCTCVVSHRHYATHYRDVHMCISYNMYNM